MGECDPRSNNNIGPQLLDDGDHLVNIGGIHRPRRHQGFPARPNGRTPIVRRNVHPNGRLWKQLGKIQRSHPPLS